MAVGKMSTCLELTTAARRRGLPARFVGTGQAGLLIGGQGVALDAVRVDYAAGAVEQAVLEAAADLEPGGLVFVEGQGSLCHPGSTATLPLLRGSQPTALLLVHRAAQATIQRHPTIPIPPLPELIACLESLAALGRPTATPPPRVAAIALNTAHLEAEAPPAAVAATARATGLPCRDPVRQGADALLDALPGLDTGGRSGQRRHEKAGGETTGKGGRARGFEPPNGGATSRCLNHLATPAVGRQNYISAPAAPTGSVDAEAEIAALPAGRFAAGAAHRPPAGIDPVGRQAPHLPLARPHHREGHRIGPEIAGFPIGVIEKLPLPPNCWKSQGPEYRLTPSWITRQRAGRAAAGVWGQGGPDPQQQGHPQQRGSGPARAWAAGLEPVVGGMAECAGDGFIHPGSA